MLACPFNYDNSSEIYTYLSDQVPCIYEVMVTEVFSGNLSVSQSAHAFWGGTKSTDFVFFLRLLYIGWRCGADVWTRCG